jgi:hypothetical protein
MYTQNRDPERLATIAAIMITVIIFAIPTAAGTIVSVDAPEYVSVGETFDVTINIDYVENLDSGQFDIYFDSKVVDVVNVVDGDCGGAVGSGSIDETDIPIDGCEIEDYAYAPVINGSSAGDFRVRVMFNLGGVVGVSGSGHLATITFEVTGKNGDHSVLNFDHDDELPMLFDADLNEINATWIDGGVTIGTSEPGPTPTYTTKQKYEVSVYAKNLDDDKLDVHLFIDGEDREYKTISSGKTSTKYNKPSSTDYKLEEGAHTFTIKWYDPSTGKWYEKTEEHDITCATTITLLTDEHDEDEDKISAYVYIKNLDDDDPNVYLYIDGNYKKYMSISSNSTGDYGEYEFEEDEEALHTFKIEWFDPGTGEDYEKISRVYVTSEEAVTLYVDKHTEDNIIMLPDETPTPVSTRSTSTATTSQSTDTSQPSTRNTPSSTTFNTDPTLSENSAEKNGLGQGTTWYTLIGLIAVVFALLQIRKS